MWDLEVPFAEVYGERRTLEIPADLNASRWAAVPRALMRVRPVIDPSPYSGIRYNYWPPWPGYRHYITLYSVRLRLPAPPVGWRKVSLSWYRYDASVVPGVEFSAVDGLGIPQSDLGRFPDVSYLYRSNGWEKKLFRFDPTPGMGWPTWEPAWGYASILNYYVKLVFLMP